MGRLPFEDLDARWRGSSTASRPGASRSASTTDTSRSTPRTVTGSRVRSGIGNVFQIEEAAAIRDNLEAAAERYAAGERVSGSAGDRYIAGMAQYTEDYKGRYLTRSEMIAMSTNPNLRIYDNGQQFLACCYDASQALCHPDRGLDIEGSPDLAACRPECANVARTDTHIAALEDEVRRLEEERLLPQTPKPWRIRLLQRIRRFNKIIARHPETG